MLEKNGTTLVLGLEHFIDKIGYQASEYRHRSMPVVYLVNDVSGYSASKAKKYNANIIVSSKNQIIKLGQTISFFWKLRPRWCELYDTGRLTIFYALIAKLFSVKLIVILRGQEFNRSGFRLWGLKKTLKSCHAIVAKEQNLMDQLTLLKTPQHKIINLPNCVPIPQNRYLNYRDIDILFLNSVRKERNVDLLLDAIAVLVPRFPEINVLITGFSTLDKSLQQIDPLYEQQILTKIETMNLRNHISTYGFVENPEEFYVRSKVFVLPADVIFLNYSLLEAMSYGVAPVVCSGEGAEKIIVHETNGLIASFDKKLLANALEKTLKSKNYVSYGKQALETVKKQYSIEGWGEVMQNLRKSL
jgi:glycosyltransferase involved in cell wall biosynthesis